MRRQLALRLKPLLTDCLKDAGPHTQTNPSIIYTSACARTSAFERARSLRGSAPSAIANAVSVLSPVLSNLVFAVDGLRDRLSGVGWGGVGWG